MAAETPPKPPQPPRQISVTPIWRDLEKHPAMVANAFMLQHTGQEFVLNVGFAAPPFMAKPKEEILKLKTVEPQVLVRLVFTPGRAVELLNILQQAVAQYQDQEKH